MRTKMPWIDRDECDIAERCGECKAAAHCPHGAFQVTMGDNGGGGSCKVAIDFEKCRLCGECSHACERGVVRMV